MYDYTFEIMKLCLCEHYKNRFVVYYFCHCKSLHVCPGEIFILDNRLAIFFKRNCPFGFLFVVF